MYLLILFVCQVVSPLAGRYKQLLPQMATSDIPKMTVGRKSISYFLYHALTYLYKLFHHHQHGDNAGHQLLWYLLWVSRINSNWRRPWSWASDQAQQGTEVECPFSVLQMFHDKAEELRQLSYNLSQTIDDIFTAINDLADTELVQNNITRQRQCVQELTLLWTKLDALKTLSRNVIVDCPIKTLGSTSILTSVRPTTSTEKQPILLLSKLEWNSAMPTRAVDYVRSPECSTWISIVTNQHRWINKWSRQCFKCRKFNSHMQSHNSWNRCSRWFNRCRCSTRLSNLACNSINNLHPNINSINHSTSNNDTKVNGKMATEDLVEDEEDAFAIVAEEMLPNNCNIAGHMEEIVVMPAPSASHPLIDIKL